MTRRIATVAFTVAVGALLAGCTTKQQTAPAVSGPSVLAVSITVSASPDTLTQDGASQSTITLQALNSSSQAIGGLPITLNTSSGGVLADFGQLSAKQVTTGSDGRATVLYTAPNTAQTSSGALASITILATPVGSDASNAVARSVVIRLVQPGQTIPPTDEPKAVITYSPSTPLAQSDVSFSGAGSTVTVGTLVRYAWDFGDGGTASGVSATHRFALGGSYKVTLVVTDDRGLTGTATAQVAVTDSTAPVASFTYSPANPVPSASVFFNASSSAGSSGRTIVNYAWDFGNGSSATGINPSLVFGTPGNYVVTLTVTDDVGKKGSTSKTLTVAAAGATSIFSFSPTLPFGNQFVNFNGTASTSPYGIASYLWDFGDGSAASTSPTPTHAYPVALVDRSYTVRLTITDNAAQTASSTQTITVKAGNGLTAAFIFSPSDPVGTDAVNFNASDSTGPNAITTYTWDFGDGTAGAGVVPAAHVFAGCSGTPTNTTDQTFVVRLSISDATGQSAAVTKNVTIKKCKA